MKVGDKVLIPVKVAKLDDDGTTKVKYADMAVEDFWVDNTEIQTVTAEDYRNALNVFCAMNSNERTEIWGLNLFKEAFNMTAEKFVRRLRMYRDALKTGQIWKDSSSRKVVVLKADEYAVHYYISSGGVGWVERSYFENNFHNTGEVLTSLATFMKDLEGLNEEG